MKNNSPTIYIVTPVFNKIEHTKIFLKSLEKQTYKKFKTIIIDDGSTDGTSKYIKDNFSSVILINKGKDMYWSKSTNLGVKEALKRGADYIVTINNDVELDKNWLKELVDCANENPNSLIGSIIYSIYDKTKVWYYGAYVDYDKAETFHKENKPTSDQPIESEWLTGMGVIIPSEVFERIGYYDEKHFPQYFGDVDLSLRASNAKYKLLVSPKAIVYNDISSDSGSYLMKDYKWSAVPRILFGKYFIDSFGTRYNFYKRYFGKSYKKTFIKYYINRMKVYYYPYMKHGLKLRIKRVLKIFGIKRGRNGK